MSLRVLLCGAAGQLGQELQALCPTGVDLRAPSREALDICDAASCERQASWQPELILNVAAYTAVDRAEQEPEAAYAVNASGAANLASLAAQCDARLIQVSTDFVFDGRRSTPYPVDAEAAPLGVYGASKLAGEQQVHAIAGDRALVLRTAWVYGRHGHNFVHTMLRLMGERERIGVVADQVGAPTWAAGLAETIWAIAGQDDWSAVWHWTDRGVASWYDFAVAIQEEALALGLLQRQIPIDAIATADYPTPAARPAYSVLDCSETLARLSLRPRHWRQALRLMLRQLERQEQA